jgi:hypothetical protein
VTGRLTLGSLISVAVLTSVPFAIGGWHHLHRTGTAKSAIVSSMGSRAAAEIVLYDAGVPIDLVLSLHRANPDKRFVVLPLAKAAIRRGLKRSQQIERRMEQIRQAIAQRGIKYVVASDPPAHSTADSSLVPLLRWDPRFQLVGSYPVAAPGEPGLRNVYLYENTGTEESE